jgi:hypothetical protein
MVVYKAVICVCLGQERYLKCTGAKNYMTLGRFTPSCIKTAKLLHGETKS